MPAVSFSTFEGRKGRGEEEQGLLALIRAMSAERDGDVRDRANESLLARRLRACMLGYEMGLIPFLAASSYSVLPGC